MKIDVKLPSPVTDITAFFMKARINTRLPTSSQSCKVLCKRDDLIHSVISGNKWRKLSASLGLINRQQYQHVVSFGGAYSNHLHALSYACAAMNIKCTAIVRGDYRERLTPTLQDIQRWGCTLHFVSKLEYKKRNDADYLANLQRELHADFMIPEGGSHAHCMQGVGAILHELNTQVPDLTHIVLPVASAGTLAGLLSDNTLPNVKIVGVGVLKGDGYLEELVHDLLTQSPKVTTNKAWRICHEYHHGGYAKTSPILKEFVSDFNRFYAPCTELAKPQSFSQNLYSEPAVKIHANQSAEHSIAIEPVYSGKCFYALEQLLLNAYFPANSKIVVLHTGGLQGARA